MGPLLQLPPHNLRVFWGKKLIYFTFFSGECCYPQAWAILAQTQQGAWGQVVFRWFSGVSHISEGGHSWEQPGLVALCPRRPQRPWQWPRCPFCSPFSSPWALMHCFGLGLMHHRDVFILFCFTQAELPQRKGESREKGQQTWLPSEGHLAFWEGAQWEFVGLAGCCCHWRGTPGAAVSAIPSRRGLTWKMEED